MEQWSTSRSPRQTAFVIVDPVSRDTVNTPVNLQKSPEPRHRVNDVATQDMVGLTGFEPATP